MLDFKELIAYEINFKNTDYTVDFNKSYAINQKEYLGTFLVSCFFQSTENTLNVIHQIKQRLKKHEIHHNNYIYQLQLESMSDVSIKNSTIKVVYTCKGKQLKPKITKQINQNAVVELATAFDIPIDMTIKNASGNVTIVDRLKNTQFQFMNLTRNEVVNVNSSIGTVTGISHNKWQFSQFLSTTNQQLSLSVIGNATITITYQERIA